MKYLFILLLSIYSYGIELSESSSAGRETYLEANCQKCHNSDTQYTPKAKAVKNEFLLKKWVSSCMVFFNHSWFPDEKRDVELYLNEIYYKFDLTKKKN
jgi:hypothetical protein